MDMDGYYIGVNIEELNELADSLDDYAEKITSCYTSMFGIIDAMEDGVWSGTVYEAFVTHGEQYKSGLASYALCIGSFASIMRTVVDYGEEFIEDIKECVTRE